MSFLDALILAIVEGLTEFLPVSSTGHMIIASSVLGIASDPFTKMFTVAIQLGAILSVLVLYWKRFFQSVDFYFKLLVAFLPAMVLGFLFNDVIDQLLERVEVVAIMLIIGGIIFLFIDKLFHESEETGSNEVSYKTALKVGLFQTIAMIPGVSRSAATIIGGLTQRLNKKTAAEFSFFLAVPTMLAATLYKLLKFYLGGYTFGSHEISILAFGNIAAFIVAILAIKSFISYLTSHGFKLFGYYRIALGIIIL
ncbi:MAG TPA: undecaprenyl-diphosphate phosphatase, partial [Cyclobacteriaceae bacterium]|nr:undecaprenyl-diphosphate phosphatase [Cyclobacteriaceae bacterium]